MLSAFAKEHTKLFMSHCSVCVIVFFCVCDSVYPSFGLCVLAVLIIKTAGTAMRQRVSATNRLLIHLIQTHPDELLSANSDVVHTHMSAVQSGTNNWEFI